MDKRQGHGEMTFSDETEYIVSAACCDQGFVQYGLLERGATPFDSMRDFDQMEQLVYLTLAFTHDEHILYLFTCIHIQCMYAFMYTFSLCFVFFKCSTRVK